MAYWIVKTGSRHSSTTWRYFQCDYLSDVNKLPTQTTEGEKQENDTISSMIVSPGSQCLCHEDGSLWLLGKDTNKWVKVNYSNGGSGGSTPIDISPISNEQIESLF